MISKDFNENKKNIKELFNNTSDLILYEFEILSKERALVVYIQEIIDREILNENLLKPLMQDLASIEDIISTVYTSPLIEVTDIEECIFPVTNGNVALFIEGSPIIYIFVMEKWNNRSPEKSSAEMVIRGPQQGFVEDIYTNKSLIRRIIKNNNLIYEDYILGENTNTRVSLVYLKNIVKKETLKRLREEVASIKLDAILEGGYIESFIGNKPNLIISTVANSEKPDIVSSKILEGRIGIICDGSPNVLTVPKLFIENLHSPEDYYIKPKYASFLRLVRLLSFIISFTLPGIYISLVIFHQEMIPTDLLISIASQREGVPLSSGFEALVMIIIFEILKESSLRLPQTIGPAVTLVGGLVLGQAAVEAGVVSATLIIIIATAGMTEFVVPKLREMITIYRLLFLFLGFTSGLYGIILGLIFLVNHLVSLKSLGTSFMWPIAPYNRQGMKDAIVKYSIRDLKEKP